MIKIYGMESCPDCSWLYGQLKGREDEFQYIDIGRQVRELKAFLKLRDSSAVFDACRADGSVGIPCFVREDGSITLVPEEAGLLSRPEEEQSAGQACRLDGSGC